MLDNASKDNVTSTEEARREQGPFFYARCTFRNLFVECKLNNDMRISTNLEIVLNYSLASKLGKLNI
jgi:hypothetical protein